MALVAALGVLSCTPTVPTQVLVVFEAEVDIARDADALHIEVRNQEGQVQTWDVSFRAGNPDATTFPVTLPLVPRDGDAARTYEIHAELFDAASVLIADARVTSGYVADELREIRITFEAACRGQVCGDGGTCVGGRCETACVEPSVQGSPLRRCANQDAGTDGGVDMGVPDAPFDAGLDESGCDDVHEGTLFCDGFEGPELSGWNDAVVNMGEAERARLRMIGGLRGD